MTREDAIKTLKENYCAMCAYGSQDMDSCDIRSCDNRDAIKTLEQEPKMGHWIDKFGGVYRCSCCREIISIDTEIEFPNGITYNYCPHCGTKMEKA